MEASAELEINLHRKGGGDCMVDFRFSRPGSAAHVRIGPGEALPVRLDLAQLRALSFNPDLYAKALSDCFFSDPQVGQVFNQARALAEADKIPLRVRLAIDPGAADLHAVYWELLQDPLDCSPLFTGENIFFSRYLSSPSMRPIRLRKKEDLSALVFVANPSNLVDYKNLTPIDVQAEFGRAKKGLGEIETKLYTDGPATMTGLVDALRAQKPAILYLVCHGGMLRDQPYLWLEDEKGRSAVTPGLDLVNRLKELADPPLLVVLASCDSAGHDTAGDMRAALGPRLAEAGIPVVVAMQGQVSVPTLAEFMPAFFRALKEDGQVERAMCIARGRVRGQVDFWMPVLFSRLTTGSLVEEPEPRKTLPLAWQWAALVVLVLAAAAATAWFLTHPGKMGPGFNIAVAEFAVQDEQGTLRSTKEGLAISQGLYDTVLRMLNSLPKAMRYDTRGPKEIHFIQGKDPTARAAEAGRVAQKWGAGVLIYGVITPVKDGYQVEPAFYIDDPDIRYGMEITGSERLGQPIPLDLNLPEKDIFQMNKRLLARAQALENLVKGLAFFYLNQYDQAAGYFQQAIYLPDWADNEGKEVLYLMLGSAYLRAYDSFNPDQNQVERARQAFEQAVQINPAYARAYIGLGAAALLEATKDNPRQEAKLYEAHDWMMSALEKRDQGEYGYVPIKVAYHMGLIHVLGAEQSYTRFSKEQAIQYFQQVLDGYQREGRPVELIWYAGNSHYMLGRLHGADKDWLKMRDESALALADLNLLNEGAPSIALAKARVYFSIGWAEENLGHKQQALDAYRRAIELGNGYVLPKERQEWQDKLNHLEKGTPNYEKQHGFRPIPSPQYLLAGLVGAAAGWLPH